MKFEIKDELVQTVELYCPRPLIFHAYVFPFIVAYGTWLWYWISIHGLENSFEYGFILLALMGCIQILACLCCHWSVHVKCLFMCNKVSNPLVAELVKVVPAPNNGSSEVVTLFKKLNLDKKHQKVWFIFQKAKYIYDHEEKKTFFPLNYPIDLQLRTYTNSKGFKDEKEVEDAQNLFGKNGLVMDIPEFIELFTERATAPFFVFQVFCVLLWCLDAYWYYSLFTLFMLIIFECTLVQQQLRNMSEIRKMGAKPYLIQTYRSGRWRGIMSDELLPGDIVSISRSDNLVPCDALLLRGPCVVDESMLTGESVPQMKECIEGLDPERPLDIDTDAKLHVLFGGTKVVQHTPPSKLVTALKAPDNGCICYVLRTSFNTAQGKLLRTILFGVTRVTANNLETFGFILFLLIFAVAASSYVWIKGTMDPERNRYKLFLECTLILTSVVPPELPIELSLAVNTSLISLANLMVYCTEPFRIPFAGKIDVCCFDKTGTLTSDDLVVEGVAGLNGTSDVVSMSEAPKETVQVVASCHSLVLLDSGLVGDPQEKAALLAIDWALTKGEAVVPKRGKASGMKIFHRFHFSSQLKRMSVVASYAESGGFGEVCYIASVKGAPETLRNMYNKLPTNYDKVYQELTRRGARVLALGRKELGRLSNSELKEITRKNLECNLDFVGFMIISCPVKKDSKSVIKEVLGSSHVAVMITGDNALTACHVAKELRFSGKKPLLILQKGKGDWVWKSVAEDILEPLYNTETNSVDSRLFIKYDFCITGDAFSYLTAENFKIFKTYLPYVKVFARVSPKQKESILTSYKALGFNTLMCGDGTNDVGALKHSHCGVAILAHGPESLPSNDKSSKAHQSESDAKKKPDRFVNDVDKNKHDKRNRERIDKRNLNGNPSNLLTKKEKMMKNHQEQLQKLLKEMDDGQNKVVKLGDASIAAPFTSKLSSIQCVNHIIKQGRCTLVTTLQMFKILALNALILAYSQSVLYLDGIKFSDYQATVQGLLLASCFLFISRSKPLKTLSKERPLPNIFNFYTISTVLLQFAVHFSCLYYLVDQANALSPPKQKFDPNAEFEANIVNSTVYIISMTLQISTFAINYRGRPYMESLRENRALLYSIIVTMGIVFSLACGIFPEIAEMLEIIDFPSEFRATLVQVLVADIVLSFVVDRLCLFIFGEGKLPKALRSSGKHSVTD